jgi:putative ABC transport system permease protein
MINWHHHVLRRARETGADRLPTHAVDELAEHLEDLYTAACADGASDADAMTRALAALEASPLTAIRGSARRLRSPAPASAGPVPTNPFRSLSMRHAIRQALRQFVTRPAFAFVTVLVLGLGIGAGVAVYTVVDAVLLRPLPYREPDRLLSLWDTNLQEGLHHEPISPVNFMDYRRMESFEDAAGWWRPDINLVDPGLDPVRVKTIETGGNLFKVLGVSPQLGQGFPSDGPMFDRNLIAVISDRLWRSRYGADPSIVGRQLTLSGRTYAVAGVMPAGFDFPGDIDVWQRSSWDFTQHDRAAHFMEAVARLKPGVALSNAAAEANTLATKLAKEFERTNRGWGISLIPLLEDQLGYYRPALIVMFGAVGLLMTIGCLNVASLLLTRALAREREVAVRTALGASPRHLITQLLAEAAVLALAGAVAGTIAALVALPALLAWSPVEIPRLDEAVISWRVLLFALAVASGATMLFGLVPALVLVRRSVTTDLKSGDRGVSRTSRVLYRALVVTEVAFAAALLVGSILLVRTVDGLARVPTGVRATDTVLASVQLPLRGRAAEDWLTVAATHSALLDQIRRQPGVRTAGAANFLPFEAGWRVPFTIEGRPPVAMNERPQAQYHSVSDGYFEAMGATLAAGRFLTAQDGIDRSPGAVIVNETFVKRFLAEEPAVGTVLLTHSRGIGPLGYNLLHPPPAPQPPPGTAAPATAPHGPPPTSRFEIVGIVSDVRNVAIGQPTEPAIYFSARQFTFRAMFVAVDATDVPTATSALRQALRQVSPQTPFADARTWTERSRARTAEPRLLMTTLTAFGGLAAILAALGIYGLFSWLVALRHRELAIRLTLGARPSRVGFTVVRQGAWLVGAGLVLGWLIVRLGERALARVLFDVSPGDATATGTAAVIVLAATLLACLPPALRAMRVDPIDGLRAE